RADVDDGPISLDQYREPYRAWPGSGIQGGRAPRARGGADSRGDGRGTHVRLIVRGVVILSQKVIGGVDLRRRRCIPWRQHTCDVLLEGGDELACAMG